jgi:hypothetical protein
VGAADRLSFEGLKPLTISGGLMMLLPRIRSATVRIAILLTASGLAATTIVVPATPSFAATPPTVAIGDVTVPEGNTGKTPARLTVRLSDPLETVTVVRFATEAGSADADLDFRSRTGTARIRAGRVTAVVTVPVFGDATAEPDEEFGLTLTDAGGVAIADADATVTILDDEARVGLSVGDTEVWEGDTSKGPAKLTVTLDTPLGSDTFVEYTIAGATATTVEDFRARSGRVRIRTGRTIATITTITFGDSAPESEELVLVTLTGAGSVPIADGVGTVAIRDDEPAPTPGVISDLAVTAGPVARYLTADWSAPPGAAPALAYDLEVTRAGTTNVVTDVIAPHAFGCGLAEVTDTCIVRVRARGISGAAAWSDPVTTATWSPPDAPPDLTVLEGGGAATWSVPASDRPIDHYALQARPAGSSSWTQTGTTTLTQAGTGCTECSFRVRAHSEIGFGDWSTVDIRRPGTPLGLVAVRDASDHELVHLAWSPPTDPGSHPITSYEVVVNGLPPTAVADSGLDLFLRSTVTWQIQVYARNLVGRSPVPVSTMLPAG